MADDDQLESKVASYVEAAKENKNVDVAALMLNALESEDQNRLSNKSKHWAYLIAIGVPPLGLLFAAWFFFSDKTDGRQAAGMCVFLTVLSIAMFFISAKLFFSSAGVSVQQIEQIKPADIHEFVQ
jgi:hypothetical protein